MQFTMPVNKLISMFYAMAWQLDYTWKQQKTPMILQFFFRQMSLSQKVNYLHSKGISLGSRVKNGRKIHIYMVRSLFVEVMYKNDDVNGQAEKVHILRGLKNLNSYLEQEFKASF